VGRLTFVFSKRSEDNLKDVHPDLVRVVRHALTITPIDFVVIEGLRTVARQKALYEKGATWTMNSRHLTGHAVDLAAWVDGTIRWDWPLYEKIAFTMKTAALKEDVTIVCGVDWKVKDGPHFELSRKYK
jgi:peptidoglycan L-alanyl-D-glutamate endopeptidase CwlK